MITAAVTECSKLVTAARLDAAGWLIGEDESAADYLARVRQAKIDFINLRLAIRRGENIDGDDWRGNPENFIPPEWLAQLTKRAQSLYAFQLDEAAGFFVRHPAHSLWGGCAFFDPERNARFFLLRREFREQANFLKIYSRAELVSHESCHLARQPLNDDIFDEFFAYQTSPSALRRYLGNCFIYPFDALFILIPSAMVFAAGMVNLFYEHFPHTPFFLTLIAGMSYLLIRNHRARYAINRAEKTLRALGIKSAPAILFRCSAAEIFALSRCPSPESSREYLAARIATNFRWQVINHRFRLMQNDTNCG